jgi:hypothetical protein
VEAKRDRAAKRRSLELRRDPVLVQAVARLVDDSPERGADVGLVEPRRDPDVGAGDRGREGMHGRVEAPGAPLKRQARHHLTGELSLRIERELAMEAGVVDRLTAVGELPRQRPDAVAQLGQHRAHLRGSHPRLEVVQQGVVDVLEALEALEAVRVATFQLDVSLQVGEEGGEVGAILRVHPGPLGERGRARDLRPQLGWHPPRLHPLPPGHPHQARLLRLVRVAVRPGGRLVEQPA